MAAVSADLHPRLGRHDLSVLLERRPVLDLAESYSMSSLLDMTRRELLGFLLQTMGHSVLSNAPLSLSCVEFHGLHRLA